MIDRTAAQVDWSRSPLAIPERLFRLLITFVKVRVKPILTPLRSLVVALVAQSR